MFNAHRGMVSAPNSRLTELLDQVRAEFDNQQNRTGDYEQQSEFAELRLPSITSMHLSVSLFPGQSPLDKMALALPTGTAR